ncbi:MAG: c-type cytochrome [Myxococcales bacterium]|nr:c-type cytochrome [Myxococcales bacterium]
MSVNITRHTFTPSVASVQRSSNLGRALTLPALLGCGPGPRVLAALVVVSTAWGCGAALDQGGRTYDRWYSEFQPDDKRTEVHDGRGGPHGNGTLRDGDGKVIDNARGHSYRFKNFWGWDLKGKDGIYGPGYQNKKNVRPENLLTDKRSTAKLTSWFRAGGPGLPAWGSVLSEAEIALMVSFIDAMRTGLIPRADDIWTLSPTAPKNYTLNKGADPQRGQQLYRQRCAGCHGAKGQRITIDKHYSLGAFGRAKAYEAWFKILAGQPHSPMRGQITAGRSESAAFIRDILAGLCDRKAFPRLADHGKDVPDGDPRCGAYLR